MQPSIRHRSAFIKKHAEDFRDRKNVARPGQDQFPALEREYFAPQETEQSLDISGTHQADISAIRVKRIGSFMTGKKG